MISMLLISEWYLSLGLTFASKYYALAVAYMVGATTDYDNTSSLLSKALIKVAKCDYLHGAWTGFIEFTDVGLFSHYYFTNEPGNIDIHSELRETLLHLVTIVSITERIDKRLIGFISEYVEKWNIGEVYDEAYAIAKRAQKDKDENKIWKELQENNFCGPPFCDLGKHRVVMWKALGIIWSVEWLNNYDTTMAAEMFISIIQIVLADIANKELCLLKTNVKIKIKYDSNDNYRNNKDIIYTDNCWIIKLHKYIDTDHKNEMDAIIKHIFVPITEILLHISLIKYEKFKEILEDCFKNGIANKVYAVRSYETIYRNFINRDLFESSNRAIRERPGKRRRYVYPEHQELELNTSPGPGYSKEIAEKHIKQRYSRITRQIKYTLARLSIDQEFIKTKNMLKHKGWHDWHIIMAIYNITLNYRLRFNEDAQINSSIFEIEYKKILQEKEKVDDIEIPISEFNEENMRLNLRFSMISYLKILGLESRQISPNIDEIEEFLRRKYNYWIDDIEHIDPFSDSGS
jgi:hypothetical protein